MAIAFPSAEVSRIEPIAQTGIDTADQIQTRVLPQNDAAAPSNLDAPLRPTASINLGAPAIPGDLANHARYEVVGFLGAGGMGTVFKAWHRLMDRPVALKVIHPDWADEPAMIERFEREIRAAARLCHPNIVVAHDAERAGAACFLVMEFVEGVSLEQRLRQEKLSVPRVCDYLRQTALGLQHAHERGVVHHDIKPQNLMVTSQGQVKILYFGLARCTEHAGPTRVGRNPAPLDESALATAELTDDDATPCWRGRKAAEMAAGYPMGTADYLAPEEIDDPRHADIRADIYSLGCTLYRCLTGQVPFAGQNLVQKLKAHRKCTPTPVDALCPNLPPALARVVARMMAKDPVDRYQVPAEVAEALAAFAGC